MSDGSPPARASSRMDALDGLRGGAIVLVVLSHGWIVWPTTTIGKHAVLAALFTSGDSAVTVFLTVSGFLIIRSISATPTRVQMQPVTVVARRVVRVGPTVWLMLLAVLAIAAMDPTDHETKRVNRDSFLHAVTFTYNWLVQDRLAETRMDLGHLWYVAVDMQAVVVVSVIAFLLRQRPNALIAALAGLFVVLVAWRFHSAGVENIWVVLNRTTARMDPFVLGALAAAVLPRLPSGERGYRTLTMASLVALLPVLYWAHVDTRYLRWAGTALELLVAAVVVGLAMSTSRHRVLGAGILPALGRASLAIYVWHFPVLHFVRRHGQDWGWGWRTLVALLVTVLIAWLSYVTIDRGVRRFLGRPGWEDLREGRFTEAGRRFLRYFSRTGTVDPSHRPVTPSELQDRSPQPRP